MMLLTACVTVEVPTSGADPAGSWETLTPMQVARQEIAAARIGTEVLVVGDAGVVGTYPDLAPNDSPRSLLDTLGDDDTLVAGHMPFVSRAVSLAFGLSPDQPIVSFKPGSLAVLDRDAEDTWRLVLFIRPEQI